MKREDWKNPGTKDGRWEAGDIAEVIYLFYTKIYTDSKFAIIKPFDKKSF